jgi:hypothetical protein
MAAFILHVSEAKTSACALLQLAPSAASRQNSRRPSPRDEPLQTASPFLRNSVRARTLQCLWLRLRRNRRRGCQGRGRYGCCRGRGSWRRGCGHAAPSQKECNHQHESRQAWRRQRQVHCSISLVTANEPGKMAFLHLVMQESIYYVNIYIVNSSAWSRICQTDCALLRKS